MDILIKNGTIIDGTGAPKRRGDVAIRDGRIRIIGEDLREHADQVVDANGLIVAPGFIDILNHSDAYLTVLKNPASQSLVAQGITTAVIGNCGASLAPITHGRLVGVMQKWADARDLNVDWERFGEFLDVVDRFRPAVNFAGLVGHTTLRRTILGDEPRAPKEAEFDAMNALLESAMQDGAFGLSFAPSYAHARIAPQWEIDGLAQTTARFGGYVAVHFRDEGEKILESLKEAIGIAKRAKTRLEISHLKSIGKEAEKYFPEVLDVITKAGQENLDIHFDVFPWQTSLAVLYLLFPQWAQEGGLAAMRKRLREQTIRARMIGEMREEKIAWEDYVVAEGTRTHNTVGHSIALLSQNMNLSPEDVAANLFIANEGRVMLFRRGGGRTLVSQALAHERSFVASAGGGYAAEDSVSGNLTHPRSFGAMPKFLGRFVRDEKIMSLEAAIAKISSGPARKVGLMDRGTIALGNAADIVVFDENKIDNVATLRKPYQYPAGIRWVFVNGGIAVNPDGVTGTRSGKTIRRK